MAAMGHSDSDCSGDEREGSERSDNDSSEGSLLYGDLIDTRLRPRKDMSVARWNALRGTAEVVVKKGKAWTTTGFTRGSLHLTFLEEAVYMVEQGSLVLWDGEKVISLLDAYSLVASQSYGCRWDDFQAYAYLKKLGYIVGRHNVPWTSPKKRPPILQIDMANLDSQFAAVNLMDGTWNSENACEMATNCSTHVKSLDSISTTRMEDGTGVGISLEAPAMVPSQQGGTSCVNGVLEDTNCALGLKLMYDVHLPNARFKKSNSGSPAFSLCITRSSLNQSFSNMCPPHRAEVRALEQHCNGRPVKFASVVCDHVTIYSFDMVDIDTLP